MAVTLMLKLTVILDVWGLVVSAKKTYCPMFLTLYRNGKVFLKDSYGLQLMKMGQSGRISTNQQICHMEFGMEMYAGKRAESSI